ncbi:molybdopterin molybdotransferase MoeA [Opitutales bacterium ASA1]|uniref:molybdopterin molybdotransferase MoeA n=1 Tax=Congregicoccus parvus TaxID=3081749 RepID=UPI002B27C6BD|nr:molybdopterin molybdotransferase MoeA [Opitutales bacterium ASA1]
MITVAEAERGVMESMGRLPTERVRLKEAHGRVLREGITADRAGPPFDRATLDGVCFRFSDWAGGQREFAVDGVQAAGAVPLPAPEPGRCLEIMTGAPLPAPCDAVLRVEDFERIDGGVRARDGVELESGTGVHPRGSDFAAGDVLVPVGCVLTGREIAVAASCGRETLEVTVQPKVAVLTTGDELVEVEDEPKPHQIRRSNDLALRATLAAVGCTKVELNHLPDNPGAISWNLERLLQQADVIVITGGVSRGMFDHIPGVLEELGVKRVFHGVAQRPGRPMYFGTFERPGDFLHPEDTRVVAIFALPGNPVSAFTCLHRYVLGGLARMCGIEQSVPEGTLALANEVRRHPELTLFLPVVLGTGMDGRWSAVPRASNTSGDFASVARTHGFVEIAPGAGSVADGDAVPFRFWR